MDGLDRGQFSGEVQKIEDQIRRRLPLGSRISERHLRDELAKQVCLTYARWMTAQTMMNNRTLTPMPLPRPSFC